MSERRKRAWEAYKKYRLVVKIIAAFSLAILGISGCIAFAKVYHNYNAAVWAGVSAAFAIVFIRLHFMVYRDRHERSISSLRFTITLWIGVVGLIAALAGLITYIVLGVKNHEKGMDPKGYFVVCLWCAKTAMWGFSTFMAARKFRKKYFDSDENELIVND